MCAYAYAYALYIWACQDVYMAYGHGIWGITYGAWHISKSKGLRSCVYGIYSYCITFSVSFFSFLPLFFFLSFFLFLLSLFFSFSLSFFFLYILYCVALCFLDFFFFFFSLGKKKISTRAVYTCNISYIVHICYACLPVFWLE